MGLKLPYFLKFHKNFNNWKVIKVNSFNRQNQTPRADDNIYDEFEVAHPGPQDAMVVHAPAPKASMHGMKQAALWLSRILV